MKKFLLAAIALAGAVALTYLFDPDRGRSRRARLADQASAKGRDLADNVTDQVEYQKGRLKGVVHDVTSAFETETNFDDDTLLQKVRSEAVGPSGVDSTGIEIDVRDGRVRIEGDITDETARKKLIELVRQVEGVAIVEDRLGTA